MELKPTGKKAPWKGDEEPPKPLESIGAGGANPWAMLARHDKMGSGYKRKRPFSDTLGATPPRDGPWAQSAASVANLLPPKTRTARQAEPAWPSGIPRRR
jgi:hypothetical protein